MRSGRAGRRPGGSRRPPRAVGHPVDGVGHAVAQQHPAAARVVVDEHGVGHRGHQRDAPAAVAGVGGRAGSGGRAPAAVVDDLDAQRARLRPQGELHHARLPRPVGVTHGVGGGLVDGQHDVGGLVVGERQRGEPAAQLPADHRQLRGVGGPAAVDELDAAGGLGHGPPSSAVGSSVVVRFVVSSFVALSFVGGGPLHVRSVPRPGDTGNPARRAQATACPLTPSGSDGRGHAATGAAPITPTEGNLP